jgi:predicted RNA-binding Zn ribbon-like protein
LLEAAIFRYVALAETKEGSGSMNSEFLHEARLVADNLALDFVNTSTGRNVAQREWRDYLTDPFAVLMWLRLARALDEPRFREMTAVFAADEAASGILLRTARALRDSLSRIFRAVIAGRAPADADLSVLNEILAAAHGATRLTWTMEGLRAAPPRAASDSLEDALWPIALAAESLLTTERAGRIKECGSSTCEWLFLDTSKNASRCWCQMEVCGNREKGRRRLTRQRGFVAAAAH